MESQSDKPPLIVIVGASGSGKSALALELAERFNGEIIAADSRTVYAGMDIGTAKPSVADQARVPHHLIDIVTPDIPFTAVDFKLAAQAAIDAITQRGKLPIMVGGTGLYIDALLYDFSFAVKADEHERVRLQSLDVAALQTALQEQGIPLPINDKNPRHLIRQLETGGTPRQPLRLRDATLVMGLGPDRETLKQRVHERLDRMFASGLETEVRGLVARYGWEYPALQTIGYQEFQSYVAGLASLEETRQTIEKNTLQYTKRQGTWFRRNKSIHWLSKREDAVDLITSFLNK